MAHCQLVGLLVDGQHYITFDNLTESCTLWQVGIIGGDRAVSSITSIQGSGGVELEFDGECWEKPMPKVPVDLLLALPRPKVTNLAPLHRMH